MRLLLLVCLLAPALQTWNSSPVAVAAGEMTGYTLVNEACGGQGAGQRDPVTGTLYVLCNPAGDESSAGGTHLRVITTGGAVSTYQLPAGLGLATDVAPVRSGAYLYVATYQPAGSPKRPLRGLVRQGDGSYALDTVGGNPRTFPYQHDPGWTIEPEGRFIATDANNQLFVAFGNDTTNDTGNIVRFSTAADGAITRNGSINFGSNLLGVTTSANGQEVYGIKAVNANSYVRHWTWTTTLTEHAQINPGAFNGTCSPGSGILAFPYDLALDSAGTSLFVMNTGCGLIERFNVSNANAPTHSGYKQVATPGALPIGRPHGFAVALNGDIYVPQANKKLVTTVLISVRVETRNLSNALMNHACYVLETSPEQNYCDKRSTDPAADGVVEFTAAPGSYLLRMTDTGTTGYDLASNRTITVPSTSPFTVSVTISPTNQATPKVTLDKSKSKYNGWVTATITGFPANSLIAVFWPDGKRLCDIANNTTCTVQTNGAGNATYKFRTPLVPYGTYKVKFDNGAGKSRTASLSVIPRVLFNESSGEAGSVVRIYFYGFSPGEQVEARFYDAAGTSYQVLTTMTIASNGRATSLITIPANATVGNHKVVGKVLGVSRSVSETFKVTAPGSSEEPTATATTIVPTVEPTMTPEPTHTGTPMPPTETATAHPTETATEVAPTETPVAPEPTMDEPTQTPVAEPSAIEGEISD